MHKRFQHPEALPDEVFAVNVRVTPFFGGRLLFVAKYQFSYLKWKTERLGGIAYNTDGLQIKGYRPLFVKKAEFQKKFFLD